MLSDHFESYKRHGVYLRGWDPKTVSIYERAFADLQTALREGLNATASAGVEPVVPLTKARLEAWVVWLRQQGRSPAYINMHIRAINAFTAWLKAEGHVSDVLKLKQVPNPTKPIPLFSQKDVQLIVSHKPQTFAEHRLVTLLCLLFDTGVRIDEAIHVREPDIDFDNLLLMITKGKGKTWRKVPFSAEMRKRLFRYMQTRNRRYVHRGYVFCCSSGTTVSYRNTLRDMVGLCRRLGIIGPRVSPHTCRHYFACNWMKNGGSIYTLSRILGHKSIQTTTIYLRSLGVTDFAQEHSRLSPLVPA